MTCYDFMVMTMMNIVTTLAMGTAVITIVVTMLAVT
jgi:hypothetical protein